MFAWGYFRWSLAPQTSWPLVFGSCQRQRSFLMFLYILQKKKQASASVVFQMCFESVFLWKMKHPLIDQRKDIPMDFRLVESHGWFPWGGSIVMGVPQASSLDGLFQGKCLWKIWKWMRFILIYRVYTYDYGNPRNSRSDRLNIEVTQKNIWGFLKSRHGDSPSHLVGFNDVSRGHRRLDWWHVVALSIGKLPFDSDPLSSGNLRNPIIHTDWTLRPFEKILYRLFFFPGGVEVESVLEFQFLAWLMWIGIELEIKLWAKSACSQWSNLVSFELILIWSVDCFV